MLIRAPGSDPPRTLGQRIGSARGLPICRASASLEDGPPRDALAAIRAAFRNRVADLIRVVGALCGASSAAQPAMTVGRGVGKASLLAERDRVAAVSRHKAGRS